MPPTKKRKLSHEPVADTAKSSSEAELGSESETSPDEEKKQTPARDGEQCKEEDESPKSFRDLGIIEPLAEACEALGYEMPTAIQTQSIPHALAGRDLIGLAETGSGKTAAFALPILQALRAKPQKLHSLILAPTRELAYQISQAVEALGSLIAVKCTVLVGGMDMIPQSISLGKNPHVVVATLGQLLDHLENTKGFSLRSLKSYFSHCRFSQAATEG